VRTTRALDMVGCAYECVVCSTRVSARENAKRAAKICLPFAVSAQLSSKISAVLAQVPQTCTSLGLIRPSPSSFLHGPRDPGADNSSRAAPAPALSPRGQQPSPTPSPRRINFFLLCTGEAWNNNSRSERRRRRLHEVAPHALDEGPRRLQETFKVASQMFPPPSSIGTGVAQSAVEHLPRR
jgi:hypothetical protein